ncbi:MAG TPA: cold-shock protein [Candidatus Bathyarchaeia archaeon]|nr:cold-shock protein [Candidatus Bathyarchaeia archaeon]
MYHSKKNIEPIPEQQTSVWMCTGDDCSCWMRENYSFEKLPTCPICHSKMVKETKMLPPLNWAFSNR